MGQTVMVTESQQARQDNQLLFIISTDDIREGFNLPGGGGFGVEKFTHVDLQHPPNPPPVYKKIIKISVFSILKPSLKRINQANIMKNPIYNNTSGLNIYFHCVRYF